MNDITDRMTSNDDIANFLINLSGDVRNNKLDAKQLQLVGEFYMNYSFNENIRAEETNQSGEVVDQNELIKFLSLGWYMYTFLIKEK